MNHRWLTTPGLLHARLLARPHGGDPVSHVRDGARPPAASALRPQRRPPSAGEPLGATRDRRRSSPSCCGTRPHRGCQSCSRLPSGRTARWCGIASEVSLWPEGEASRATRPRPDPAPLPLSLSRQATGTSATSSPCMHSPRRAAPPPPPSSCTKLGPRCRQAQSPPRARASPPSPPSPLAPCARPASGSATCSLQAASSAP